LELAAELPDLRVRLLGRADESIALELRRRAVAAGRPGLLEIVGFVPHEKLPAQLGRAHVLVSPAPHEPGPGMASLEAMACGLPVIACAGSGAAEVVTHEQTGLLVPPRDKTALVAALRRLLTDATTRAAMGARARRYALENADSKVCLARLESFYQSVVHRPTGHACGPAATAPAATAPAALIHHVFAQRPSEDAWLTAAVAGRSATGA
jgi:glycosyltransferase involved in cell wall biosynthesis